MVKRSFDLILALLALGALAPVLLIAALGIRLSSRGPILYRARRVGRNGATFIMHKFRTMRVDQGPGASPITASQDSRVFWVGSLLRRLKIDELPQLFDVVRGKMSIVGPRPEDCDIVEKYFTQQHRQTLCVRPGLASPGSIYNYTHGESLLSEGDPEKFYVEKLLPIKLALEVVYVRESSILYDCVIILRTIGVIACIALGKRRFADPPEMRKVQSELIASLREVSWGM